MVYEQLYENLIRVSPDGSLYSELVAKASAYYTAQERLNQAIRISHPSQIQFKEEAEGTFRDLEIKVAQANISLQAHFPPLPIIPTERSKLTELADEIVMLSKTETR